MVIYLPRVKNKTACDVTACGKSPWRWYIQRAPNKNTKRASDESYRQRWLKASGTTAATVAAKV